VAHDLQAPRRAQIRLCHRGERERHRRGGECRARDIGQAGEPLGEDAGEREEHERCCSTDRECDQRSPRDEPADATRLPPADQDRDQSDVRDVHPEAGGRRPHERDLDGLRNDAVALRAERLAHEDLGRGGGERAEHEAHDVLGGTAEDVPLITETLAGQDVLQGRADPADLGRGRHGIGFGAHGLRVFLHR